MTLKCVKWTGMIGDTIGNFDDIWSWSYIMRKLRITYVVNNIDTDITLKSTTTSKIQSAKLVLERIDFFKAGIHHKRVKRAVVEINAHAGPQDLAGGMLLPFLLPQRR